jgi:hypothetical protein
MSDPPDSSSSKGLDSDNAAWRRDRRSTAGTPRWVKVSGIIAVIVLLLLVFLVLTRGAGGHGPSRHTSSDRVGGHPVAGSVTGYDAPVR